MFTQNLSERWGRDRSAPSKNGWRLVAGIGGRFLPGRVAISIRALCAR
jgi:hypothetical protein